MSISFGPPGELIRPGIKEYEKADGSIFYRITTPKYTPTKFETVDDATAARTALYPDYKEFETQPKTDIGKSVPGHPGMKMYVMADGTKFYRITAPKYEATKYDSIEQAEASRTVPLKRGISSTPPNKYGRYIHLRLKEKGKYDLFIVYLPYTRLSKGRDKAVSKRFPFKTDTEKTLQLAAARKFRDEMMVKYPKPGAAYHLEEENDDAFDQFQVGESMTASDDNDYHAFLAEANLGEGEIFTDEDE